MWRSGTSLLYALLNQHPEIQLLYESEVPLLSPLFASPARSSWASRLDFWNGALRRHGLHPGSMQGAADLATAFEMLGQSYATSRGATIWGCKSPNYYALIPSLAQMFPHGRYIFIWRDPEEICASILRAADTSPWFRRRGMWRRVLIGCEVLKRSCQALRASGFAVHEIYYRDLAEEPAAQMRSVCEFLGISFDPSMTSLEGADFSAVYDGDHHELLRRSSGVRQDRSKSNNGLPPDLKQKIHRYKALWHAEYPNWNITRADPGSTVPSRWEQYSDRAMFTLLQLESAAPRWLFSFLPLWCWRTYRRLKYKDPDRFIASPAMRDTHPQLEELPGSTTSVSK